tara:strand:- start:49 stop:1401 length:1353 start_codon:yes stop_codon:yes gene_type:complete
MRIDSSGRVGIGTSDFSNTNSFMDDLVVENTAQGSGAGISIIANATNGYSSIALGDTADKDVGRIQYNHSSNQLDFHTNGDGSKLTIDSSGKVGIGTTSPSTLLHTNLAAENGSIAQFGLSGQTNNQSFIIKADDSDSLFTFRFGSSNSTYPAVRFNMGADQEAMRIDSSGNVGIGTSSPNSALHVEATSQAIGSEGTLKLSAPSNGADVGAGITFGNNIARRAAIIGKQEGTDAIAGYLALGTRGTSGDITERMRITSDGVVCIGTTTANTNGDTLTIAKGSGDLVSLSRTGTGNARVLSIQSGRATGSTTANMIVFDNASGSAVGTIQSTNTSTSFNTSSDYRLKENAVAISDGITRLKTLKPYRFNFKADASITVDGFFAHEVTAVPEAITGTKDEVITQEMIDNDNAPKGSVGDPIYQGIDQSKLVPLLVAAVQELITKVETLEAA